MVQENQEFMVFIGFSNVAELLDKKTLEKPIKTKKKHDFQTMVQENQKFMVFIGFCNVSELFVKKTLEKPIKTMNSSFSFTIV